MDPRDFTPHLRLNLPPAQSCQSVNEKFGTFSFRLVWGQLSLAWVCTLQRLRLGACQKGRIAAWPHPQFFFRGLLQLLTTGYVKGFGCRPLTDGAASTEAWGRRPKASKEGNRGKWHGVVQRALWGIEHDRRGGRRQLGPLIALIGDVAAHAELVAGAGIPVER